MISILILHEPLQILDQQVSSYELKFEGLELQNKLSKQLKLNDDLKKNGMKKERKSKVSSILKDFKSDTNMIAELDDEDEETPK